MDIVARLDKPFLEIEKLNFIVENNHNNGFIIEDREDALVALDYSTEEKEEIERKRLDSLSLTAADVERAIYKAKGIDFEDIIELVQDSPGIDIKALKIELKANNFYRGNPWINQIGTILGYSSDDLDYLFENKELPEGKENGGKNAGMVQG